MEYFKSIRRNGVESNDEAENVALVVKVIIVNYQICMHVITFSSLFVDFLTEDVKDDIKCAKVIYNRYGFKYWKGWLSRCKSRPLPDVSKCSYASNF